ncbi:ankyrin [Actibacterium mucosum KCTC 23349]|uniref:Ankyrin n=1 Tax=Actibacterium mucosum KCTC 23349 TaxID=1454373 RepID=A0A037ZHC3_9RHOB|nr:ankyrin repeat domain-containing protein [Actibacterium mucosum]KAJ54907.1 ankyrin [Actibacterium mucosum KCTC 23349]
MTDSIEKLRRAAKQLRKSYESGEPAGIERLRVHPPRSDGAELKHADFLHVIAREHGFLSWPILKEAAMIQGLDRAQKLQHLKISLAHGNNLRAQRLLEDTPDLADGMFALQVALLRRDKVAEMLAQDPTRATTVYGISRPIVHLAFSRWIHTNPDLADDMIAIAQMLLDHGADVNDSRAASMDTDYQLSALYGAIGHANNMALGDWLLENGADPNDGESLYHATELGHHEGLRLLLKHGADPAGTNALLRAMDFNDHEAVQMLLDAGAKADDFNGAHVGGEAPWVVPALHQAARRMSDARMIDILLKGGADPARVFDGATAYAYARVFGNTSMARAIEAQGTPPPLSQTETLLAAAADGQDTPGTFIDPDTLSDSYRNIIRNILHLPGKMNHVQELVALGLEYDRPDTEGLTPVQVAGWEGLPDMVGYFLKLGPDLSHINGYGGTLLSTIIHGSENNPNRAGRDYLECLQLALERGVALPKAAIDHAAREDVAEFLRDWAEAHPGQVILGGVG